MLARIGRRGRAAHAVAHQHEPLQAQCVDDGGDVAGEGRHAVVARGRRIGAAVAAQVDGDGPAAQPDMLQLRAPVPHVAGKGVDKEYGKTATAAVVHEDFAGRAGDGGGHGSLLLFGISRAWECAGSC
jgi:hypothetical protein